MAAKIRLVLIAIIALAAAVYVGDYLSLRFRIPARETFGSVTVQRYYEVALKSRKTEYMREQPQPMACVHSMFPHYGSPPCWYLVRHPKQIVKVGSIPSDFWRLP